MKTKQPTSIRDFSYFQTGGVASKILMPSTLEELADQLRSLEKSTRIQLLGLGSNSLVSDDEFDGVFVLFKNLVHQTLQEKTLIVGAGVENTKVAEIAYQKNLDGTSWLYHLPGQIGATTRMNARCYGGEISQIVSKVVTMNFQGERREYNNKNVFRGYKDTVFMGLSEMIIEVHLSLEPMLEPLAVRQKMDYCYADRVAKGQFRAPSCGCVFKNNYQIGVPSGMLLDAAGVKNLKVGGAIVSDQHANFIFNINHASARDILELSFIMRDKVYETFGVWLSYEMEILGTFSRELLQEYQLQKPSMPKTSRLSPLIDRFKKSQKPL